MKDNEHQGGESADASIQFPANSYYRILVVDDNSATRQLSVDVLSGSGYKVDAVTDGAAGWEALQKTSYDLAITDNTMPRLTGLEMIAKLRFAHMALPVIMATGHLPMNEFDRMPWLKPDATLQRPFSDDDLLEAVKKVLRTDNSNAGRKEPIDGYKHLFPRRIYYIICWTFITTILHTALN